LAAKAFEVLTNLVRQRFEYLTNEDNHAEIETYWPDVQTMLDAVSFTTPPITVREKIIRAVLHTYSPNVPQ
jgi:hypothetical protein